MVFPRGVRALLSAALVVVPLVSATAAVPPPANPVISSVAPDPSVLRGADGAFHVYASSDDWSDGAGYRLIPHFRSFDLVEWEYVGDAFAERPAWAQPGSFLWAPDVHPTDSGAVMYYTTGGQLPCSAGPPRRDRKARGRTTTSRSSASGQTRPTRISIRWTPRWCSPRTARSCSWVTSRASTRSR